MTARAPRPEGWLDEDRERRLRRVRRIARLLDSSIRVPGSHWRIGLDSLVGLLPGVGDLAGGGVSLYLLYEAWKIGVTRSTLAGMAGRIAVDVVVGSVPLLGDLFDAAFKANLRNARQIEKDLSRRGLLVHERPPLR